MPTIRDGLFKPKFKRRRANGRAYTYTAKNWYYTFTPPLTRRRVKGSAGTADRKAALLFYAAAINRAETDAKEAKKNAADPYRKHGKRSLLGHLDDWHGVLVAEGNTQTYADLLKFRAKKVVEGCGFTYQPDVSASSVQIFIGELRKRDRRRKGERGASAQTRNFYLQAIKQFSRWLLADGRAPKNPLAHMRGENVKTDRRHDRRPLEVDELRLLLAEVEDADAPTRYGVLGADRAKLYRFAAETGIRSGEIRCLTWGAFDLDADPPTVTIEATYAKSGRTDVLPLTAAVAQMLRAWRARRIGDTDDSTVFRMPEKSNVARMLRADLDAARAKWIEASKGTERKRRERSSFLKYVDAAGRYADFLSLRHSFASALARGGVPVKAAQDLLRHTDVSLTLNIYSHSTLPDLASALEALPDLNGQPDVKTGQKAG